jgi:multiple sugar transport system substrate-binding protein
MNMQPLSRRDFLKWTGAAAAVSMLAACTAPAAPQAPAAGAGAEGVAGSAKTTVELWTGFGQGRMAEAMTGAIDRFNESQDEYTIEHVVVPWGEIRNKVVTATAAGNPPDVYRGWANLIGEDAPLGGLTDLTPYVEAKANIDLEDFWPATLSQMKFDDKIYGMSISTMVTMLYFNKDRMQEEGVDPETLPSDLEGWEAIGEKLYEINNGSIEKVGFSPLLPFPNIPTWGATRGLTLWDPVNRQAIANDATNRPIMVDLLNWYKSYADKYGAEELQAFITSYSGNDFGRNTPEGVYYTGRLGVWALETWLYNDMKEYGPEVNFGVTKLPSPRGVEGRPGFLNANMYLVPANCKQPEGGFEFGNFMASDPWVAINKCVPDAVTPSRKSNAMLPEVLEGLPWAKMAIDEILPAAMPLPSMPSINTYLTNLEAALNSVVWDNADPGQAVDDAVAKTQADINQKLGIS